MANGKNNTNGEAAAVNDVSELQAAVKVPAGDVLVRRVRGGDGQHMIGLVKIGRLYTISLADAAIYCAGPGAEFEPVTKEGRAAIDTASNEAKLAADTIAAKEKELAALKAGK